MNDFSRDFCPYFPFTYHDARGLRLPDASTLLFMF